MTQERELRPAEGRHPAVLRYVQVAEGVKSPQVVMSFELVAPSPEAGFHTSYFGSLSEEAGASGKRPIDHTVNALRNCGWTGDDLSDLPQLAESDMLAEIVELVVAHETFEGKRRAKVQWVNRQGGGKIKLERAIEGNDLKDFGQRMRTRVGNAGNKPVGPRPAASPPRSPPRGNDVPPGMPPLHDAPPRTDDDIPF